jgi:hypothetical protein
MKAPTLCWLILAGMFLFPFSALSASYGDIYVSLIDGDVLVNTADTQDWVSAASNTPLGQSDRVWVANGGKSELRLRHGTAIRLNSRTGFEVGTMDENGFRFFVDLGEAYIHVESPGSDTIVIETPAATIRPDQRSSLRIDVSESGEVSLSVLNGAAMVDRSLGGLQILAGQRLVFKPDWARPLMLTLRSPDAFDKWNRRRDEEQFDAGRSESRRYLPEELGGYAADFDHNGRWVETPEYGFVWTPTALVIADWSPYRSGRWVWMRGNYVWISYDKWGWAPHHYGRWAFVRPFGWCWVPPARRQAYWGPGYVGWVHTAATISWVPLAPRELYYGHGFHGPQSMDVSRLPKNTPMGRNANLYRNVRVTNGVTTVHRDTFLTGKPLVFKAQPNPFLNRQTVHAPPSFIPERTLTMPQVRDVKGLERPPERIFTRRLTQNVETQPKPSLPGSLGPGTAPQKGTMPSIPDGNLHIQKPEIRTPHVTVPLPPPPPQPVVKVPKAGPPEKVEQPVKAETKITTQPGGVGVPTRKPALDALKRPLPPQAAQAPDGPKNPVPSLGGRGDTPISDAKVPVKKALSPTQPAALVPKKPLETTAKTTSPVPKPPTSVVVPVTPKVPAVSHKPPAPDLANKGDTEKEKHGKDLTDGKDHQLVIQKGGVPEKEGQLRKEPRPEREMR